jgi:hypothetical protein
MEPFEVLVEMLRADRHETIGGPPQLAKIYRHMNAQLFAVTWPSGDGVPTLAGRELLSYEELNVPVLDPDHPTTLPRQAPGPSRTQQMLRTDSLLLPAIEGLGAPATVELLEWSETHTYGFTPEDLAAWLEDAEHRGLVRIVEDGRAELVESPPESTE